MAETLPVPYLLETDTLFDSVSTSDLRLSPTYVSMYICLVVSDPENKFDFNSSTVVDDLHEIFSPRVHLDFTFSDLVGPTKLTFFEFVFDVLNCIGSLPCMDTRTVDMNCTLYTIIDNVIIITRIDIFITFYLGVFTGVLFFQKLKWFALSSILIIWMMKDSHIS